MLGWLPSLRNIFACGTGSLLAAALNSVDRGYHVLILLLNGTHLTCARRLDEDSIKLCFFKSLTQAAS